jgi:type III pantothenate kinase
MPDRKCGSLTPAIFSGNTPTSPAHAGNSEIKVGLFSDGKLLRTENVTKDSVVNYHLQNSVEEVIVSSLGKHDELIEGLRQRFRNLLLLNSDTPLPIKIDYQTGATLGVDRIAAAVGAATHFDGLIVVIDAGSCITCDLIDKRRTFIGGTISPGLQMRLQAMHNFTANLPLLKLREPDQFIGKSTEEGMISGTVNGARKEIVGYLQEYKIQFPDLKVIICGGNRFFFDKINELDTFVLPNLVLEGLYAILKFNGKV